MTGLPSYPAPSPDAMGERDDKAPPEPAVRPGMAKPPQGDHAGAGGLDSHRRPGGGMGMGHQAPPGWPAGYQC